MGVLENALYSSAWNRPRLVSIGLRVSAKSVVEMAKSAGTVKQPVRLPGMESNSEFRVISSVNAAGEDCLVYILFRDMYSCVWAKL